MQILEKKETGIVVDVRKDIVTIDGIPSCVYGEILEFAAGDKAMVIEFDSRHVIALALSGERKLKPGDIVISRGNVFKINVTDKMIGRIVNSLGLPVDGKGSFEPGQERLVFDNAVPILDRAPLTESLKTGIKIIDAMIPIGKGQRELIIGDRQTGKSTIATDTIMNQKDKNIVCIYCWVGGGMMALHKLIETLALGGALGYTIIVAAPASSSAAEQYLAPYAAAAIGEYFMHNKRNVFVVFDNLTKHAWIYRQMSLLLKHSPGREAYPGDIFYIHSQLLERAARLKPEFGGGSMTFFPIVDTLQGDVTGFVPSNLVSITDGQIYMSSELFNQGFRPAVDIGLSVSRIGSKVQSPALKKVSGQLRLEYARYRELQKLTKLRTKVSDEIAERILEGQVLTQILTQKASAPVAEMEEILIFYAYGEKLLNKLTEQELDYFQKNALNFIKNKYPDFYGEFEEKKALTPEIKETLDKALAEFLSVKKAV